MKSEKKICQECKNYDRVTKKCKLTGEFTKRKGTCEKFKGGKKWQEEKELVEA
jgi:hypothetical protein